MAHASIEVTPERLIVAAQRLRAVCAQARRLQAQAAATGPDVTGSAVLSAALDEHAQVWGWTVEQLEDRVRAISDLLAAAGQTYTWLEECLADAATTRPDA